MKYLFERRFFIVQKHKNSARGVLYVVDASNVAKTIADSTEFLFRILSDPVFHKNAVPVMVVCNKSDLETAKSAAIIERELVSFGSRTRAYISFFQLQFKLR